MTIRQTSAKNKKDQDTYLTYCKLSDIMYPR